MQFNKILFYLSFIFLNRFPISIPHFENSRVYCLNWKFIIFFFISIFEKMGRQQHYQLLSSGRQTHAREPHLPKWQSQMNQHHAEVGGEVAGQKMPLKGPIQEPDLRVRRSYLQMNVSRLINLSSLGLGRKNQANFTSSVTTIQFKYFPSEAKLRM